VIQSTIEVPVTAQVAEPIKQPAASTPCSERRKPVKSFLQTFRDNRPKLFRRSK
jgi:hypothetical protein